MTSAVDCLRSLAVAYSRSSSLPVSSVAVVGNAPLLPSDARADAIDGADLVIRVNSFVLDSPGRPRCQGARADVVLFNRLLRATPWFFAGYQQRLYLLVEPMRMHGNRELWPTSWPADLGLVPVPNRDVTAPLCELLGVPWREERLAPTTGTMAAYLAVTLFPGAQVIFTGFSFLDDPDQKQWRHQWGDACAVGREHRIRDEAELIRSWVEDARVHFLR